MIYKCKNCGEGFRAEAFSYDWKNAGNSTSDITPKIPIKYCPLCGGKL